MITVKYSLGPSLCSDISCNIGWENLCPFHAQQSINKNHPLVFLSSGQTDPQVDASQRKFSNCVQLVFRFANLHCDFGQAEIHTQVDAGFFRRFASPYLQTCVDLRVRLARTLRYHLSTSSRFLVRIRRRHQSFNSNYQKKKASLYSKGKFNESSFSL